MSEQTGLEVIAAAWSAEEVKKQIDELKNEPASLDFPEGRAPFVNNSLLKGYPFLIVSHWREARVDSKTFASGKEYPAHQVMQVMVRTVNPNTYEVYDPELATLSGEYLLNQFRNATPNEYILGGPWTIRENPRFVTKRGTHPDMLARYRPEIDNVTEEYSALDETLAPKIETPFDTFERVRDEHKKSDAMLPNSEPSKFNLITELANRGLNEAAFLKHTNWQSITGHTDQEYRTALTFIDRTLKLREVEQNAEVGQALRELTEQIDRRHVGRPRKQS